VAFFGLFVLKGEISLHVESEEYLMPAKACYVWDSVHGTRHKVESLRELPDWTKRFPSQSLQAKARQALENLSRALSGREPQPHVDIVLASTLQSPEPTSRVLAVFCLGAVNDVPNLLDALADEKHGEVRGTAAFVLKYWLNLKPENQEELKQILVRKNFSADQAEIVVQLLRPLPLADLSQPATYEALIAYLRSDRLAIRELAFEQLQAVAPVEAKDIPYDPAGDSEQRNRAVTAWKKRIPDGKLPARPAAPPVK
jgi:hypothetical protein